ncbi:MAG: hypothetical protein O3A25_18225 [Acidobacteria bacterium]|nr:hypothetical protein [Acidobacteriota bacterium]
MRRRNGLPDVARPTVALIALLLSAVGACTESTPSETPDATSTVPVVDDEPAGPQPTFINLLPWAKVDFARGRFPSADDCNMFVRALPNYSGYTAAERCEPIDDPVYCTAWSDDEEKHLDCFKGSGGCEVELKRHDLMAESGARTIAQRCEPSALEDAWARFQADAEAADNVDTMP